ncbi:Methyltransferase-like protein 13 [Hypsibius exemplaris]|uniref:Methyltransferase-like protein 13 n=1 Tax=Hypsibius exemplaris TaxID=2072580 RepID=A0A1W0X998_HYPEX|nr:Methyltransferase-like protein 13 [Hypsibius exemplaris]
MAPGKQDRQVNLSGGKFIIPSDPKGFQDPKYWDTFFASRSTAFEWYGNFLGSADILCKYIKPKDDIMVIGCGNSEMSAEMYYTGLRKITNIDISQVVVDRMAKKYKDDCPDMKFVKEDVMNMSTIASESFSVVLDKATFDALVADGSATSTEIAGKICCEVDRVLKLGGRYICITLGQRHVLNQLVITMANRNFAVRAHVLTVEASEQQEVVFCFVFTKMKPGLPLLCDMQLRSDEKITRVEDISLFLRRIHDHQTMEAFSRSLRRGNYDVAEGEHVKIFNRERKLKFCMYPVKQNVKKPQFTSACFIIPPGRSKSYLYGTHEGRQEVAQRNIAAPLVMFAEVVEVPVEGFNFESVKQELTPIMRNLCPPNLFQSMVFITDGAFPETDAFHDSGDQVIFEGTSQTTGDYRILERPLLGRLEWERRLVFSDTPQVSQTEIRLTRDAGSGDGLTPIFDRMFLPSDYQKCIIAALLNHKKLACEKPADVRILLIGLGGGVLASFIHENFPTARVEAVELDPAIVGIAIKYFGLKIDERCAVHVADGLQYARDALSAGERFDIIIVDCDTKNPTLPLRCPPEEFVKERFLQILFRLLNPAGMCLINIVTRKGTIAHEIESEIVSVFGNTISTVGLDDELNVVTAAVCSSYFDLPEDVNPDTIQQTMHPKDDLRNQLLTNLRNFNRMMDEKGGEILLDGPSWWSRVHVTYSYPFASGNIRLGTPDSKSD